jgi:hypothetical protein
MNKPERAGPVPLRPGRETFEIETDRWVLRVRSLNAPNWYAAAGLESNGARPSCSSARAGTHQRAEKKTTVTARRQGEAELDGAG